MRETIPGGAVVFLNVVTDVPADANLDLTTTIRIETNQAPLSFPMRLRVAAATQTLVPTVDFGGIPLGSAGAIPLDVSRIAPLGSEPMLSGLSGAAFDFAPVDLRTVEVRFAPTTSGPAVGTFTIDALKCAGRDHVQFIGDGVEAVLTASASSIDFGDVPVGTTATRTLLLQSRSSIGVELTQDVPNGPFRASPNPVLNPATRDGGVLVPAETPFVFEFSPTRPGPQAVTLRLWGSSHRAPAIIDLALVGTGVP